jgi:cytochrome P450 family 142 subfamily A polypeptide 1
VTAPTVDLLSGDFYVDGARTAYAWMRRHAPVYFDDTCGLWAIASYDGVLGVGRDPVTFSSAGGSRPDTGPLPWMIDMDAPDHLKRRKLVNRGFTPARVRDGADRVRATCDELIDAVCERGACDFVHDLAAPLPMIVIGDMLGVPPADRADLLRWSDDMLGSLTGDPAKVAAAAASFGEFLPYAQRMIADRQRHPTDDLVSVLVHAEVDGDRLDESAIVFETLLLLLGGDETTRNVASGGMEQLLARPDERRRLAADPGLLPTMVEEILRWVSPIKNMNRMVTRDTTFLGQPLRTGDKVLLLYESANFDEAHFDEPGRFDVGRTPNDHLAFGFGAHFCLGASLARLELQALFERVLRRLPDLELATDEPLARSITGIAAMPVRFTPTAPVGSGGSSGAGRGIPEVGD